MGSMLPYIAYMDPMGYVSAIFNTIIIIIIIMMTDVN